MSFSIHTSAAVPNYYNVEISVSGSPSRSLYASTGDDSSKCQGINPTAAWKELQVCTEESICVRRFTIMYSPGWGWSLESVEAQATKV